MHRHKRDLSLIELAGGVIWVTSPVWPPSASCRAVKRFSELDLGAIEAPFPLGAQVGPRPIDIEVEHRHRRAERVGLASLTALSGALERKCNGPGGPTEHVPLEIQGVAALGYLPRPAPLLPLALLRLCWHARLPLLTCFPAQWSPMADVRLGPVTRQCRGRSHGLVFPRAQ